MAVPGRKCGQDSEEQEYCPPKVELFCVLTALRLCQRRAIAPLVETAFTKSDDMERKQLLGLLTEALKDRTP